MLVTLQEVFSFGCLKINTSVMMGKQPFSPPSQWWYSIILQTHLAWVATVYIMSWAFLVLFFIGKEWTCMAVLWQCEKLKHGAKSIFCCQNLKILIEQPWAWEGCRWEMRKYLHIFCFQLSNNIHLLLGTLFVELV